MNYSPLQLNIVDFSWNSYLSENLLRIYLNRRKCYEVMLNPIASSVLMQVGISNDDTPMKGKAACTKFTRISTNGTYSIVLCEPVTGRTHQVR